MKTFRMMAALLLGVLAQPSYAAPRMFAGEALASARAPTAAEEADLASALTMYSRRADADDLGAMLAYVSQHPDSPWAATILAGLGDAYLHQGRMSKAITSWTEAWKTGRDIQDADARRTVDKAIASLVLLQANLGDFEQVRRLFTEIGDRKLSGPSTEAIQEARELLDLTTKDTRHLYICGANALYNMMAGEHVKGPLPNVNAVRATPKGMSLGDVERLASGLGEKTLLISRPAGTPLPSLAVIHWKTGHYAAIVEARGGRYHVMDPIYPGDGAWLTQSAIEEEASPEMLVPASISAHGSWKSLPVSSADRIWGRGPSSGVLPGRAYDRPAAVSKEAGCPMCGYNIDEASVALTLSDTPVGYSPPVGPAVRTVVSYNQRDDGQASSIYYTNLGPKWTVNWVDFIVDDPVLAGATVSRYTSGTTIYYNGYATATGRFAPQQDDGSILVRGASGAISYRRVMSDGSVATYAGSDGSTSYPRRIFLTEINDPQGNAVKLAYSGTRIASIKDAGGRSTVFGYDANGKLTSVTDPFNRVATLQYNPDGTLGALTDIIGIKSAFGYDGNGLVNKLTTPYGVTNFSYTAPGSAGSPRFVQATDASGKSEREEWIEPAPGISDSDPAGSVPIGLPLTPINQYLSYRDSFHWDKDAYVTAGCTATGGCDYTKARNSHFLHTVNGAQKSTTLESVKLPLQNRIWYQYQNQTDPLTTPVNTILSPIAAAQVLDDGATQITRASYNNAFYKMTQSVDPAGRTTNYAYSADVDLAAISQTQADGSQIQVAQFIYNTRHRPTIAVDASGQASNYAYNAAGQITKATDALGHSTVYHYDALGRLTDVVNANGATQATYTYDSVDRIATATDSEGWMVTYAYDAADRVVSKTYPDASFEKYVYDKLDLISYRDRKGLVTRYDHDAMRNLVAITNPSGARTQFGYSGQGRLLTMTDAKLNVTSWIYDVQGRPTLKTYPDGKTVAYAYEAASGRLHSQTDALGQVKTFTYGNDNRITAVAYTGAINPTPGVTYAYDPIYPRVLQMVDGTGTTTYAYGNVGTLGALAVKQVTTPATTIAYSYDELGRPSSKTVGTAGAETFTYDALGRAATHGSDLGTFTYAYLGQTGQVASRSLNGTTLSTTWAYQPNSLDRRLSAIHNAGLSTGQYTDFSYAVDPNGMINGITQSSDATVPYPTPPSQTAGYNNLNQLTTLGAQGLTYDANGNLTADGVRTYTWDAEDRLVGIGYVGVAGKATAFTYDGLGRRVAITSTPAGGGAATTTKYAWCGSDLCAALTPTNGIQREYLGEGEYLTASGGQRIYYGIDQIGSVRRAFTSGSAPAYDYDPYGNLIGGISPITDYAYAGLRQNADSGLYLSNTRPYNPGVGRWLRRDMAGEGSDPAGNLYAYNSGNAVSLADPNGTNPLVIGAIIGAGIGSVAAGGYDLWHQLHTNGGCWNKINRNELLLSAGGGALGGAAIGLGAGWLWGGSIAAQGAVAVEGDHIVLGLTNFGLEDTAAKVGGRTLLSDTAWQESLQAGLSNPSTRFTLSLDGMTGSSTYSQVMGAAQRGVAGSGGYTDWEVGQLYQSGRLASTDLYYGGQYVPNPFGM